MEKDIDNVNPIKTLILDFDLHKKLTFIDWEDLDSVREALLPILEYIKQNRSIISKTLSYLKNNIADLNCDEDIFYKRLLLFESADKSYSIRLMSMMPTDKDFPHDHRATFGSLILNGGYRHITYKNIEEGKKPFKLVEQFIDMGDIYFVHHATIHSTRATENQLSIQIRGNSAKSTRVIYDIDELKLIETKGRSDEFKNIENQQKIAILEHFEKINGLGLSTIL